MATCRGSSPSTRSRSAGRPTRGRCPRGSRWWGSSPNPDPCSYPRPNPHQVPKGSSWRKNPIPTVLWEREGPSFEPLCTESEACR